MTDKEFYECEIYSQYESLIIYVSTISGNTVLAKDIVQEAMTEAWKNIDRIKSVRNIRSYLYGMARNIFFQSQRKRKNISLYGLIPDWLIKDNGKTILTYLIKTESVDEISKALCALSHNHQRLLVMHYYYDMSIVEIAKLTNQNYNTVASQKRRAIKMLRDRFYDNRSGGKGPRNLILFLCERIIIWDKTMMKLKSYYIFWLKTNQTN